MWKPGESCSTAGVLGVKHEARSEAVNAALVDFGSEHSFDEAAIIFERHYKFKISDATIRRITESIGEIAEQFIQNKLEEHSRADEEGTLIPPLESIFLGFDGCSIRTGTLEVIKPNGQMQSGKIQAISSESKTPTTACLTTRAGRPKCKRNEEWRDVRLGFAKTDQEDAKKWFVGGMADFPTLVGSLFKLGLGLGMTEVTKPVATADGGNGLYEELDKQFCDLQFILDYYHFREHLYDTAKEGGLEGDTKNQWVNSKTDLAWEGRVDELIEGLEAEYAITGNDRTRRLVGYITRFRDCINYGSFREKGLPIGSGEIESAHKYVTQKRLKLAGACWRPEHVNPMLALRLVKTNGWWEEFWNYQSMARVA